MNDVMVYIDGLLHGIEAAENPAEELKRVVEGPAYDVALGLLEKASDEQLPESLETVDVAVENLVNYLLVSNDDELAFYERLWAEINRNEMFDSDGMRSAALFALLFHAALPYSHLDDFVMEPSEFKERRENLSVELRRLCALKNRNLSGSLQRAAALLDVIESRKDRRDRAMLLSYLIYLCED